MNIDFIGASTALEMRQRTTRSVPARLARVTTALALGLATLASADPPLPCRVGAVEPASTSHPYQRYGNLCEGDYRREVANSLALMSLTVGPMPSTNDSSAALNLSWPSALTGKLIIAANVLAPSVYYVMNTDPPVDAKLGAWTWPLDRLRDAGHQHRMVGLRATIETSPGSQPTVVPLRVLATAATPGTAATVPYVAVFQTADDISKLYTTLVDEVDGKSNIVWRNREEPAGDYPSQMPIILKIPRSAAGKGSYLFTVKAQARSGFSPATVRFVHD